MTSKQTTLKENLGTQPKVDRLETPPLDNQVEKNMTQNDKKIAFYKGVQAMRKESRMKEQVPEA